MFIMNENKNFLSIKEGKSVFVRSIECDKKDTDRLNSLGVFPYKIITMIKNEGGKNPIIMEISDDRFAVNKKIAEKIIVSDIFCDDIIFDEKHKKTMQKLIILKKIKKIKKIKKMKKHFSLKEIKKTVQNSEDGKSIGDTTIYRMIKFLTEKGILETITTSTGEKFFELKKSHHDHVICENCGNILEFRKEEIEKLQKDIEIEKNIESKGHLLQIFAKTCPKCKGKKK